jgi:hypothetical protein
MKTAEEFLTEFYNSGNKEEDIKLFAELQKDAFHAGFLKGYDVCNAIHAATPKLNKIENVDKFIEEVKG